MFYYTNYKVILQYIQILFSLFSASLLYLHPVSTCILLYSLFNAIRLRMHIALFLLLRRPADETWVRGRNTCPGILSTIVTLSVCLPSYTCLRFQFSRCSYIHLRAQTFQSVILHYRCAKPSTDVHSRSVSLLALPMCKAVHGRARA